MYSKHKDAPPAATIEKARKILDDLGIKPKLRMLKNTDGIYSAQLFDSEGSWSVNGKGTSEEYCMASAYGECMERLQAYYIYEPVDEKSRKEDGFRLFPDEGQSRTSQCRECYPYFYEELLRMYALEFGIEPSDVDEKEFTDFINIYFTDTVVTAPYFNIKTGEVEMLPEAMISTLCGSNGLCAGNTPHEALNQGIAEILERHVKDIVFREKLTPPDIPRPFLKERMPELYDTILQIESMGPYSIIIKDVSLGKGMPVIGAVFTNHKTHCYHAKFGSSFSMDVAVERCLTELFQGFDLQNIIIHDRFMTPFDIDKSLDWENPKNRLASLKSDTASVPLSFFGAEPSWEFKDWEEAEGYGKNSYDNKTAFRFMLDKLSVFSDRIYIRDFGFLKFPAYRIFVPDVSVTRIPIGPRRMKYRMEQKSLNYLRNYPAVSLKKEVLDQCYDFITADDNTQLDNFDDLPLPAVQAVFYYVYGETGKAVNALSSLNEKYTKFTCAALELKMQLLGMETSSRDNILSLFFEEKEYTFAKRVFRKDEGRKDQTFLIDRLLDPQGKKLFAVKEIPKNVSVTLAMRKKMKENMPDQRRVADLFQEEFL